MSGALVVVPYSDSALEHSVLFGRDGSEYAVSRHFVSGKHHVLVLQGVSSRTEAELLCKQELFVRRDDVALADDEVLVSDLIGQDVRVEGSSRILKVVHVHNFGAGDIFELQDDDCTFMVPFAEENFDGLQTLTLRADAYAAYKQMV